MYSFGYFPGIRLWFCRRFGTLYQFHLQGLDVEYEVWLVRVRRGIYTRAGVCSSWQDQWGMGASGSRRFRVGEKVWRGRYKRRVSGCGRVIVCCMVVPFFLVCVEEASRRYSESGRLPCSCYLVASLSQWPPWWDDPCILFLRREFCVL